MSIIAPGIMVITVFLLASALMFGTFLTASATQGDSLKDLATVNTARAGDQLDITTAAVDTPDSGDLTVTVDNTGSRSTPDFSRMDREPVLSAECWDYAPVGTDWSRAVTIKFTLKTAVTTGVYTVRFSSSNAASATEDFSV